MTPVWTGRDNQVRAKETHPRPGGVKSGLGRDNQGLEVLGLDLGGATKAWRCWVWAWEGQPRPGDVESGVGRDNQGLEVLGLLPGRDNQGLNMLSLLLEGTTKVSRCWVWDWEGQPRPGGVGSGPGRDNQDLEVLGLDLGGITKVWMC